MDKKRILLIDDEVDFIKILKCNLEKTDKYEVRMENEGLQGIIAAKEFKPDVILLDVLMPDIDGGEVAFQLRNDKDTKNIPIVFLTALATKDETKSAKDDVRGRRYIAKPVDIKQLIDVIEKSICPK